MHINQKILIVEDDLDIAELLRVNLIDISMQCDFCHRGDKAVKLIVNNHYDLIILDLMLPGVSGIDICREVRLQKPYQPILMLTAKSSELDQIIGLEVGADDYMTKPFSIPALQARVRSIIRRSHSYAERQNLKQGENIKNIGGLYLDSLQRKAIFMNKELDLTALEFDLLNHFMAHPEQVFSRSQLLDKVWGYDHEGYEHTVNSHINRLRNKLNLITKGCDIIQTVWGVGYRLNQKNCSNNKENYL